MSRSLDDLAPVFRPKAVELLARLTEAGIPVMIVDTLRTPEEHAENLLKKVSWTKHSKHLDGRAIDVCPFETWNLHGPDKLQWNAADPIWQKIGAIGESLGLKWGVWLPSKATVPAWLRRGGLVNIDLGHFEFVEVVSA